MNRIFLLVQAVFFATILTHGFSMDERQLKDLHRTLRQPAVFQVKYGNTPHTLYNDFLPDSLWEGVTLQGWVFKEVKFVGTKWHNVKVIDGVFENCEFDETEFMNNTFVNTKFIYPKLRNGIWGRNKFNGGSIEAMQFIYYANWIIDFQLNEFEGVAISHNQPKNQYDVDGGEPRNGSWRTCSFKKCHFEKNSFYYQTFDAATFDSCTFERNDFTNTNFQGKETRVSYCTFKDNTGYTVGSNNGVIEHSTYDEDGFAGHNVNDVKIESRFKGGLMIGGGKDIHAQNLTDASIVGGNTVLVENISSPQENSLSIEKSKNITIRNVKVKKVYLENVEDAVFENIEMDELHSPVLCTRCTFKNVLIKKLVMAPVGHEPVFVDCKFENMRRAPGVLVERYMDKPPVDMVLPWEVK